jgi:hypothetical protein
MTDIANDTQSGADGDPEDAGANAPAGEGSKSTQDPVSLLTSRLNGQTAKVGELTGQLSAKDQALKDALARIADLETGKVSAEEAATARVAAAQAELERERNERRADSLKTRFPETFSVLGDAAFALEESALAANEARLLGDEGEGESDPPTPLRHNENRSGAPKGGKEAERTAADVRATLEATPLPW